jgi:hypothetical protein
VGKKAVGTGGRIKRKAEDEMAPDQVTAPFSFLFFSYNSNKFGTTLQRPRYRVRYRKEIRTSVIDELSGCKISVLRIRDVSRILIFINPVSLIPDPTTVKEDEV